MQQRRKMIAIKSFYWLTLQYWSTTIQTPLRGRSFFTPTWCRFCSAPSDYTCFAFELLLFGSILRCSAQALPLHTAPFGLPALLEQYQATKVLDPLLHAKGLVVIFCLYLYIFPFPTDLKIYLLLFT